MELTSSMCHPANFQRDGAGVHDDNQGSRPNYPSTQAQLNLPKRPYQDANHTIWVGFTLMAKKSILS